AVLAPAGSPPACARGVAGGDRRLELVRAWSALPHRPLEQRARFVDRRVIPEAAVLLLERDQVPRRVETGRSASVVQQEQAEQTECLRLVGHQLDKQTRKPDRLGAEGPAHEVGGGG